jgi:small subunit ribosomal protein S6e
MRALELRLRDASRTCLTTSPTASPPSAASSRPAARPSRGAPGVAGRIFSGLAPLGGGARFISARARPPRLLADLPLPLSLSISFYSRAFYDKRISAEVEGEALGEEYKGYLFKIMGGNDKQGFGMKQGVLTTQRVFLLMVQKTSGFQGHGRRKGERRRKACRGCIVSPEIAVLNLMIVKQGENPIPGLTDDEKPRMRGPKRASKIRKLFNLSKEDDVRKYVNTYRREFESATGKKKSKAPKIQRLVTANTLQRKRTEKSIKKAAIAKKQSEAQAYHKLLALRLKEARERRSESLAKRRASSLAKKEATA